MLRRLATLSPTRVLIVAAIWPVLLILVVALVVAIKVTRADRAGGLIAVRFNVPWALVTLLLLPPLAFVGLAAVARRGSTRR